MPTVSDFRSRRNAAQVITSVSNLCPRICISWHLSSSITPASLAHGRCRSTPRQPKLCQFQESIRGASSSICCFAITGNACCAAEAFNFNCKQYVHIYLYKCVTVIFIYTFDLFAMLTIVAGCVSLSVSRRKAFKFIRTVAPSKRRVIAVKVQSCAVAGARVCLAPYFCSIFANKLHSLPSKFFGR